MRITEVLYHKINRYRAWKLNWVLHKRQKVKESRDLLHIKKLEYPTVTAEDFLEKAREEVVPLEIDSEIQPAEPLLQTVKFDSSHPLYQSDPCFCLDDSNVLLEGLAQSKLLLNTVQLEEGLPKQIEDSVGTRAIPFQDTRVKRVLMSSQIFDATQVLLPKRKDPERPAWDFPRDYGIDAKRKFHLTISQMLQLCNVLDGKTSLAHRTQLHDAYCCTRLVKDGTPVQIRNRADILVTSKDPIAALVSKKAGSSIPLPDIHPLHFTVSIPKQHFYHNESIFPLSKTFPKPHPHTAFFHYDPSEVKNLYEEPVTESQFLSRTLVKAFAVAASRAQQLYGDDVKELPEPLTLQVVHTDNKKFHFGVLQLNTLDLISPQERNIFWMLPSAIHLFEKCGYETGRPTLQEYNPEVFQRILAFYFNGMP
ncbi:39S ribosomal protein L37, mitochondrial [Frankliniella fusca]|uniref:39S ribosomal protein L37, mitochondrial n=1 Tax=Frankliniella fusca TaxID=407009 RepID=A0AAE1HYT0_9NEOP|nr:39S ribosomal protein L37, mitochondrial [Frankliniella fusca]